MTSLASDSSTGSTTVGRSPGGSHASRPPLASHSCHESGLDVLTPRCAGEVAPGEPAGLCHSSADGGCDDAFEPL